MPTRLSTRELSLLALDTQHTPGHVSMVHILEPGREFDSDLLVAAIRDRLAYVPRYRMHLRTVPGALAAPVWVEDEQFDLSYHVQLAALPRGGTEEQLREFVSRVCARRLDRSRPLWEVHLVEGLAEGRFALITKTHQLLIDGLEGVDLGQVLIDESPECEFDLADSWEPAPEPRSIDLLVDAVRDGLSDSDALLEAARRGVTGLLGTAVAFGESVGGLGGALGGFAGAVLRGGVRPPGETPLAGPPSEQRRVALVSMPLDELRALRRTEQQTVHDVILALITGALRLWLATREVTLPVHGDTKSGGLLAMVPMSVPESADEPTALGSQVEPRLVGLPVDEDDPLRRLELLAADTQAHREAGLAVDAPTLSEIAGFAPGTLHTLGVRAAAAMTRPHDLLITDVPGPQQPLYAAGVPLVASYPVLPLPPGQLLTIGVTSYAGQVCFGLAGDRDALSDLAILAQGLTVARLELQLAAQEEEPA